MRQAVLNVKHRLLVSELSWTNGEQKTRKNLHVPKMNRGKPPEGVGQKATVYQLIPPSFVFDPPLADLALLADSLQYSMAVTEREVLVTRIIMVDFGVEKEAVVVVWVIEPTRW